MAPYDAKRNKLTNQMLMNNKFAELNPASHRGNWRVKILLILAILTVGGNLRANDFLYQYDSINGLTEADYHPTGTQITNQIAYVNDPVGNRLGESIGVVSMVNQHLTIQFKEWGGTAPLNTPPRCPATKSLGLRAAGTFKTLTCRMDLMTW
jgi:hypothetical protein